MLQGSMLWNLLKRWRGAAIATGIVAVVLVRVGFLPLFGGLGYEFSLATGLVVPGVTAVWTSLAVATGRRERQPMGSVLAGLARGGSLAGLALVIGLLHGVRAGVCDLSGGLVGFVLGPGVGALVAGAWGALAGEIARSRKRRRLVAVLVALAGPIGGALLSVWRFYSSPMIFAFDPFVGYFSGTLYDTVVDAGAALLWYRAGSVAVLAGALLAASILRRDGDRLHLETPRDAGFWTRAAVAAFLFGGRLVELDEGDHLGHWSTSASIARELGGVRHGARCDVVYPESLREDEAALLAKDCDEEVAADEKTLGTTGPKRITAFFFSDAAEKRRLMGAADTYIAKPWREEVYLQLGSYPHPVLGHEIAHVVAGSFGRGPFRIAGSLGGLFPNPGLIEGVAVATSPDDDELTDLEWAAAMKRRGALPPMSRVFSVGFLGESAAKSYTLAGAFVRWVMTTKGSAAVRAWYGGESIEKIFGESFGAIDAQFRASLDAIVLPPAAEAYVASKFERPSVFGRKCPHVVDALRKRADTCRESHQIDRARGLYADALALDPSEQHVLLARGIMEMRSGDAARGRNEVAALATDARQPLAVRNKAREALADDDLLSGRTERAATEYSELAAATPDEDSARALEVKAIAARDPDARTAITTLLVAAPPASWNRPADPALAAGMLGEWRAKTGSPLATYLLGKSEIARGYYALAATDFDAVLAASATLELTPRVRREALRERAVAACALGDAAALARVRALAEDPDGVYTGSAGGRREGVVRLLDRCAP